MRRITACLVVAAAALVVAAPAAGMRLGQVAPAGADGRCGSCEGFQAQTAPASPSYALPGGKWTIDKWRTRNTTGEAVHARLSVFRARPGGNYKVVGASERETIPAHSAPAFKTHIHAHQGDMLGLDPRGHMVTAYSSPHTMDIEGIVFCHPQPGEVVGPGPGTACGADTDSYTGNLVNIAARAHRR
jgi:hypothetical protein